MLKKSECEAYKIGKKCREDALKKCVKASDKKTLENGIKRDEAQISNYCS